MRGSPRGAGFTLIEVLVVVIVIAIASAMVVANLDGDDRGKMEREARRLAAALEHAASLAQWQGETLGVSAEGSVYRFWRQRADGSWTAIDNDAVLAPRALPADFSVTPASYGGAPVAEDAVLPFRASGRNEPYSLLLANSAWSMLVAADPLNRVHFAAQAASR
jgi:type II secretion system protein H